MVNAGLTTFIKIEETNARELELVSLCKVKEKTLFNHSFDNFTTEQWRCMLT